MHQPAVTFRPTPLAEPTHLTQREARQFRRLHHRQLLALNSPD
jgi:hypothetical protein